MTLFESQILMYVEALHSFTHAIAADSVSCLDEACAPRPRLIPSMKCFFLRWRGEHGAPESAFTISSKTFCNTKQAIQLKNQRQQSHLLDSEQVTKSAVATQPVDSSCSPKTNPKYRKTSRSIYKTCYVSSTLFRSNQQRCIKLT